MREKMIYTCCLLSHISYSLGAYVRLKFDTYLTLTSPMISSISSSTLFALMSMIVSRKLFAGQLHSYKNQNHAENRENFRCFFHFQINCKPLFCELYPFKFIQTIFDHFDTFRIAFTLSWFNFSPLLFWITFCREKRKKNMYSTSHTSYPE